MHEPIILTREIFEQGRSSNGGYSGGQLSVLGISSIKLNKGWPKSIIGKSFHPESIRQFLELKDSHLKQKKKKSVENYFEPITNNIAYRDQYLHPNWQRVRLIVLGRDGFMCVNCKSKHKTLHVHHLKYIKSKFIWEVPLYYLVTLCETCHSEEHGRDLTSK
jgi:hypothetical protein